jgi:multiple antibiotic resistance protein
MHTLLDHFITALATLFVVIDPLANIPVFLAMTIKYDPSQRRRTCRKAVLFAGCVLTAFALLGDRILSLFGITIPAFRVVGGVILFIIAFQMLQGRQPATRHTPEEQEEGIEKEDVSIVPLAIPVLSGPGAITTVLVLISQREAGPGLVAVILAAIWINCIATWVILRNSEYLVGILGKTGVRVLIRLMGLLLAAMAVQFIMDGVDLYLSRHAG